MQETTVEQLQVRVINKSGFELPKYQTPLSAGMDLHAVVTKDLEGATFCDIEKTYGFFLRPLERKLIPTGIYMDLPEGYEAQIRPRSGMAYNNGVTVLNAPGTIDADYRDEVKVLLVNVSDYLVFIHHGTRIAQMVVAKHDRVQWQETNELSKAERPGGFGSTGTK